MSVSIGIEKYLDISLSTIIYNNTMISTEEPEPGLDARCYRANGFFNHEDPEVCNKYDDHDSRGQS